jgi:c-di-GMP-binding flagellar brake protein YcgR
MFASVKHCTGRYNHAGELLHPAGLKIEDQQQLNHLLDTGYCSSDYLWDSIPTPVAPVVPVQTSTAATGETQKSGAEMNLPVALPGRRAEDHQAKDAVIDLDSVRWTVGEVFYLQADNAAARYTVRLIGFVKNKTILVTAPLVDGKAALIREGQHFIVRAFPGKKAYAFSTALQKNVYSPYPYLHLDYPKEVRSTTIRQAARASVKIIAAVSVGSPEQSAAATLGDLSIGGASGTIKRQLGHKGDAAIIKFRVNAAGADEYLSLKAILRSVALG